MRRHTIAAFAIVGAALVMTAPVAAQGSQLVVVSQNTTASDFEAAEQRTGLEVLGSGDSGYVAAIDRQWNNQSGTASPTGSSSISVNGEYEPVGPGASGEPVLTASIPSSAESTYNPVNDEGDGSTETFVQFVGDTGSSAVSSGIRIEPTESGAITELHPRTYTSDDGYSPSVDIYIVQEAPDQTYQEGTLVKEGWTPDWSDGRQSISLNEEYTVSAGTTYTIEFVTQSADGDGSADNLYLNADDSASSTWTVASGNGGQSYERYGDLDVTLGGLAEDLTASTASGASADFGTLKPGDSVSRELDLATSDGSVDWSAATTHGDINWSLDLNQRLAGGSGEYVANHSVGDPEQLAANLTLGGGTATIAVEEYNGSSWSTVNQTSVSASGNHTLDISAATHDQLRTRVTFDGSSGDVAELHDESILFDPDAPTIESASPADGTEASDETVTLSANVSDPDFGTAQGDTVTAEFYLDGDRVDTQTLSSNGTVSTEVEPQLGGNHTWHVELEDSYGETATLSERTFRVPAELRVFYETEPNTLINEENTTLSIRVYPLDNESGDIVTRPVENGTADLTGLPVGERFVVTVQEDQSDTFVYRRIILDSIYDSERIFLLRENQTHVTTTFELQDPTGQFPPTETELYVEKPITVNGSTQYFTIAGDTFGATARFPVVLQEGGERYRLRIRSDEQERILGAYTPAGGGLEPLQIQRIEPEPGDVDTGVVYGGLTQGNGTSTLAVRFRGGESATQVTYRVTDTDTGDVVVPETTVEGASFAHLYEFNTTGDQGYNVSYTIEYADGNATTGSFRAGQLGGIADRFGMDPQVASLMSWVTILGSLGLLALVDIKVAPAGSTAVASGLSILGTVAIPMPFLGMMGAVSVLALFGGRQ